MIVTTTAGTEIWNDSDCGVVMSAADSDINISKSWTWAPQHHITNLNGSGAPANVLDITMLI